MSWKECDFKQCGRLAFRKDKLTGLSYCQYHYKSQSTDLDRRSIIQKAAARVKEKLGSPDVLQLEHSVTLLGIDIWFEDRRKEMTGRCLFCGGKTEKNNDTTFKRSAAHLFAKRKNQFPSIALHPENCIELCFFDNSCHSNFDLSMITFEDIKKEYPKAWNEIVRKTKILYPIMTTPEQNKVPDILIAELNVAV